MSFCDEKNVTKVIALKKAQAKILKKHGYFWLLKMSITWLISIVVLPTSAVPQMSHSHLRRPPLPRELEQGEVFLLRLWSQLSRQLLIWWVCMRTNTPRSSVKEPFQPSFSSGSAPRGKRALYLLICFKLMKRINSPSRPKLPVEVIPLATFQFRVLTRRFEH